MTAICAARDTGGELAAAEELRRRFPALPLERALTCARMITGPWPQDDDDVS